MNKVKKIKTKKKSKPALKRSNGKSVSKVAAVSPKFLSNDLTFLFISIVLSFIYFTYSFFSDGFYQQDGPGHYINMREFWLNPNSILGNWSKTGFKLIYVVPALFGINAAKFATCILSAFSGYFAYRVTKNLNKEVAFLAFILLSTQHMWVNFSFRFYAEIASAFFIILSVFFHQKSRFILAALAFSYVGFIRQEFYPIAFGYFIWLIFQKRYIPALMMGVFPLFYNIWGGILSDDPLYLINSIIGTSDSYAGAWDKMGFDHYFKFFSEVYGGTSVALLVAFLGSWALSKKKMEEYWIILFPAAAYLLLQSLFNLKAFEIGPGTGGTVRYLLVISPLIAVMGALGAANVEQLKKKWTILLFLLPVFIITAMFLSFEMPSVTITNIKKWDSTIMMGLTSIILLLPLSVIPKLNKYYLYAIFAVGSLFYTVKPYKLNSEDAVMKEVASWYQSFEKDNPNRALHTNHPMFYYFFEQTPAEMKPKSGNIINDAQIQQVPKGSIIIWESHYGYRPTRANYELQYTYFTEKPDQYKLLKQFNASDNRFVALAFEKL